MPTRSRQVYFPVSPEEERRLLTWANAHERAVSAQVRWYLRDILNGRQPPEPVTDDAPEPVAAA
jgi:hypothetical protein